MLCSIKLGMMANMDLPSLVWSTATTSISHWSTALMAVCCCSGLQTACGFESAVCIVCNAVTICTNLSSFEVRVGMTCQQAVLLLLHSSSLPGVPGVPRWGGVSFSLSLSLERVNVNTATYPFLSRQHRSLSLQSSPCVFPHWKWLAGWHPTWE